MPPPPPPQPPPPPPPPPSSPPPLNAHRLPLPPAPSPPTSLLLAPAPFPARAFALLFPDASARLFASLPAPTPAASPAPAPTPVPSPLAAAACFALLLPSSHLLFLSAHPAPSSPAVHLRAYSLASGRFAPAPLSFKRHVSPSALPLHGLPFGLGVRLAAGVNAVALLSLAAGQIWVLAPRMAADRRTLELHKCAVIQLEPTRPVYAMEVAMGRLLLGEAGGVRVFPLRSLMKGGREKEGRREGAAASAKKSLHKKNGILNGLIVPVGRGSAARDGQGDAASDQTQILWVSDGGHSIQILSALPTFDVKSPKSEDDDSDGERELATIKLSATEAIFTSEKVQDIVPISKDSVLILGQGDATLCNPWITTTGLLSIHISARQDKGISGRYGCKKGWLQPKCPGSAVVDHRQVVVARLWVPQKPIM
ncbi:atherin-like [Hordeum vulgare]|nr:atherin-like [Hordeum vulgare]